MKFTAKKTDTLSKIIREHFPESSGKKVKQMITEGTIFVNGEVIKNPSTPVEEGTPLEYQKRGRAYKHTDFPFRILFEDEFLIAVEKPAGLVTVAKTGEEGTSLYREIKEYFQRQGDKVELEVVHRLDYEVGGVLLLAKVAGVRELLHKDWQKVEKIYLALTEKIPPQTEGEIDSWLVDGEDRIVRSYDTEVPGSKYAETIYEVINTRGKFGILEVKLGTGRKNQIRVHLAEIGCPIVGDRTYGFPIKVKRRIRLWAKRLSFQHPKTKRQVTIEAQEATDFYTPSPRNESYF